jgi:hypothetical protein
VRTTMEVSTLKTAVMVVCVVVFVSSAPSPASATSDYYRMALKRCEARRAEIAEYKRTGRAVVRKQRVEIGGPVEWKAMFVHPRLCLARVQVHNFRKGKGLVLVLPKIIRKRVKQLRRCAAGLRKRSPQGVGWITLNVNRRGKVKGWKTSGTSGLRWQARCIGRGLSVGLRGFKPWGKQGTVKLALVALD